VKPGYNLKKCVATLEEDYIDADLRKK